jgi:Ca2+-binding EF-hand superfamily protein
MYVAWLPEEKVVATEDLSHFHASLPRRASEKYRDLAIKNYEALKNAGIDAETFIQYHGEAFSKSELEEAFSEGALR